MLALLGKVRFIMPRSLSLALIAALSLLPLSSAAADRAPYVIPAVLSQTGAAAFLGTNETKALMLIEEIVNGQGGLHGQPIKFDVADDQSNPLVSAQLVTKIAAGKPPLIVGPGFVATCLSSMGFLAQNGPVSYCFAPGIRPPANSYVFSSGPDGDQTTVMMVRWLRLKGWKRVAVITTTDASGQAFDHGVQFAMVQPENKDVTLVAAEHMNPGDLSATAQMVRIKTAQPDAVLVLGTGTPWGTMMRGAADVGLSVPIIGGNGNATISQLDQYTKFLPKDLYFAGPPAVAEGSIGKGPIRDAQTVFFASLKKAGLKPDLTYTQAWDPTMLLIDALRHLGTNASAQQVRDWILSQQSWAGISGIYDFKDGSQRGVGQRALIMLRWDKDKESFTGVSRPAGYLK
jgi:branched-chain amino acid transport system substrate-binding protein